MSMRLFRQTVAAALLAGCASRPNVSATPSAAPADGRAVLAQMADVPLADSFFQAEHWSEGPHWGVPTKP